MRKFVLFFIICLLLVSCSSKAPKKTENPVDLYVAGVDLMKKKKYDDSIKKFTAIREQYPFDPMALVATVKLGDAYFLKKDYVLAAGTYEDYFKAHPDEENIPYVLFKLGECYEKLSPSVDRDQANTFKGIERITYLRNRYPNSPYAAESEKRLEGFIQKLADRELYVGEFYVRTAQYNAAIMRLELLLKNHPRSKNTDKVLFYLYDAHRQLGNQEKANEYLETLRTKYPKSIYARATIRERKTLKITQAQQPKPAGKEDAVHKQADGTTQTPPPGGTLQSPQGAGTQAQPGKRAGTQDHAPTLEAPATIESQTIPMPRAKTSLSTGFPQAAETPQTPQYVERQKKVIDLRPPEQTASSAQPEPAAEPSKTQVAEAQVAPAPDSPKGPVVQAQPEPARVAKAGEPLKTGESAKQNADKTRTDSTANKALGLLDQKKPIDIASDTMEGFDKEKYVLFKGNVVARQDDLYIYSDTLEAFMSADTNEIDKANAKGNVRIIKQNKAAACKEAFFDNIKGEILLKGDAVVTSDKDKVEGDVITYYVNEDRAVVTAEKTKKAKITVYPKQEK
ncbi:MAG: lipopolysaccharide transport periplasmic protein LptA [Syntrophorhabdaceae bacterium]|nr:lipopolysaccharide transport periplasmic protein LptA [Syntrophorhabdaceae bacterium]MDD4196835.1 lipopolysaccharide transport periplasmic protein LptA [Syntrophorhabdaceae bacterium]